MSDGKTHAAASLLLSASFVVGSFVTQQPEILKCAVGSLVGIFITPDLDLSNSGIVQGALIRKKVGWFGERMWKWFWKGYSTSAKHGSFLSHFPVFSTFIRLSYVYFLAILIPTILIKLLVGSHLDFMEELQWWGRIVFEVYFFIGLAGSDFIHWCLDIFTTDKGSNG